MNAVAFPRPMTQDGQPDPLLRELARDHPVLAVAGPGGGRAWLVTSHDAAREVLSDPARFTSVIDPAVTDARARAGVSMVGLDPPDHTRVRRLAAKAFTARRIQRLVPSVERLVASLLDDMERAGSPADLVTALSVPLPLRLMCQMLDLPDADQADFLRWSDVFTGMTSYAMEDVAEATGRLHAYMTRLASERRERLGAALAREDTVLPGTVPPGGIPPGPRGPDPDGPEPTDVLSDLIRARDGQDALTEQELLNTMVLLLVAGHQTTVRAITRGVLILLSTGQWQRLVANEADIGQVVEEVLRHQTPIDTGLFRRAVADTEFRGAAIKAGEAVFISVHLANFDPRAWPRPDVFDPDRGEARHLAFGYGVHFCLGAPLARVELNVALSLLAARFPGLHLDIPLHELTWTVDSWLNTPVTLPVAW